MNEYEGVRRVMWGDEEGASFIPVCPTCGRFVKADAEIQMRGDSEVIEPNATCSKCGRVAMLFEGYV